MSQRVATLNESGYVTTPNLGDGEVTQISFHYPNASITVALVNGGACTIEIVGCRYLSCATRHTQNVIDSVLITSDIDDLAPLDDAARQQIKDIISVKPGRFVQLVPITGPDLVGVGDDVRVTY
ncbi:hypothetical protein ASD45_10640 [Pseudolabrys sp. Root1462]|uniref:hypothetical protein n=1 Tax=Pseudolabrys sp. Root1462 TaxID=1736466 RepID=UPI000702AE86|nr:hypothetical protein [Pseudolabrys sp. Root1462]KQZ01257.1 hypothetical protein ASD45_10640 [Pseudolabrys sp. Root1462]